MRAILMTVFMAVGIGLAGAETERPVEEKPKTVCLIVDYNDGVEKCFTALPWEGDMTALDAIQLAAQHPRGIEVTIKGRGKMSLLTRIDDLKNTGSGRAARNWLYWSDGEMGKVGIGAAELEADDVITLKFTTWKEP